MAGNKRNIPKQEIDTIARCFLTDIQAFFESEEGRKEFEIWKNEQTQTNEQKQDKAE